MQQAKAAVDKYHILKVYLLHTDKQLALAPNVCFAARFFTATLSSCHLLHLSLSVGFDYYFDLAETAVNVTLIRIMMNQLVRQ
jgi:hypothetical protein